MFGQSPVHRPRPSAAHNRRWEKLNVMEDLHTGVATVHHVVTYSARGSPGSFWHGANVNLPADGGKGDIQLFHSVPASLRNNASLPVRRILTEWNDGKVECPLFRGTFAVVIG